MKLVFVILTLDELRSSFLSEWWQDGWRTVDQAFTTTFMGRGLLTPHRKICSSAEMSFSPLGACSFHFLLSLPRAQAYYLTQTSAREV